MLESFGKKQNQKQLLLFHINIVLIRKNQAGISVLDTKI